MSYLLDLFAVVFFISVFSNAWLCFYISSLNKKHLVALQAEKKKPDISIDARAILADLASGPALIKVEYVDRSEVLLRSPRHFS